MATSYHTAPVNPSLDDNQKSIFSQDTPDYCDDCNTGKKLAAEYLYSLKHKIKAPDYSGFERHMLRDFLLCMNRTGLQVGFCYELSRQIEGFLVRQ